MTQQQKVALVTGASRGIGRAIAERLGADGAAVVVNYRSRRAAAEQVVAAIEASGGRAVAARADVTDPKQLLALFDTAEECYGGLDVLVSNAGVCHLSPFAESSDEAYDLHFDTNTRPTFIALREGARRVRDGGRIVVISTGNTAGHRPGSALYAASKAAGDAMARVLAQELGPRAITVNCVLPGLTAGTSAEEDMTDALVHQVLSRTPLGRLGEPEDIADIVGFLTSDQARWITGQQIAAGGGRF